MMRGIVTFVFRKRQSHDASATVQVFKMMKGHTRHSPEQGCCCCCCCCCCRRRRRRRRHRWPLPPPPFSDRTHSLTRLQPPLAMTIMALFSMLSRRPNAEQCVPLPPPPPTRTHVAAMCRLTLLLQVCIQPTRGRCPCQRAWNGRVPEQAAGHPVTGLLMQPSTHSLPLAVHTSHTHARARPSLMSATTSQCVNATCSRLLLRRVELQQPRRQQLLQLVLAPGVVHLSGVSP